MPFWDGHENVQVMDPAATLAIDAPISCLSFVPGHPDTFIIGTYKLLEPKPGEPGRPSKQARAGSLRVFKLRDNLM